MPPPRSTAARTRFVLGGALLLIASVAARVVLTARDVADERAPARAPTAERASSAGEPALSRDGRALPRDEWVLPAGAEEARALVPRTSARTDERLVVARGRVTLEGAALPGALDVFLCDADGRVLDAGTTGERGEFELRAARALEAGWSVRTDDVLVAPDGARRALAPDAAFALAERALHAPPIELRLDVLLPTALAGRVVDAETGAPIEDALVCARDADPAWESGELSTRTGADGRYRLELDGLAARSLQVDFHAEGRRPRAFGPLDPAGSGRALDVALARPLAWRGRVVSASDGRAVRGATITIGSALARPDEAPSLDAVDEAGRFAFAAPDVPIEGAWLHVGAPGFAPVVLHSPSVTDELVVALDAPVVLEGSVRARGSGAPLPGAVVRVVFEGEPTREGLALADEARADANGAFALVLESAPFDAARVEVEAPDRAPFIARLADLVAVDAERRARVVLELSAAR